MLKTPSLKATSSAHQVEISDSFIFLANTFTPLYSTKEDRIRLAINYDDYAQRVDFWITRSFFLKLLPFWEEFFYKHSGTTEIAIETLQNSKHSTIPNASTNSNIPNSSKTDTSILQLMEKEALLLESVDMQFDHKKSLFKITLKGSNTEGFAYLTPQMMIGLLRSIFQSAPHMQWGISPALLM